MKHTVFLQISKLTSTLIKLGLSIEQNFPSEVDGLIYIGGNKSLSIALKNISYQDIYNILEKEKNYNIKMIDGALIQMMYTFDENEELLKSRLAFFPAPDLLEFQNNVQIYEMDEIYADMLDKNIVSTPLRFDYDPENFNQIDHPAAHFTIGQYKNCRIPVSTPISPNIFIDFILRNFYHSAKTKFMEELELDLRPLFSNTVDPLEKKILHLSIYSCN